MNLIELKLCYLRRPFTEPNIDLYSQEWNFTDGTDDTKKHSAITLNFKNVLPCYNFFN